MKRSVNDKTALCSICDSNSGYFYRELNGFNLYSCKRCKLLWVEGISPYELVSFYDHTYFNSDSKIGYNNYLADEKNHRRNAGEIINVISKIRDLDGLRVLDVGCAFGFLLDELNRLKRCEGYGIEISSHAFAYAKSLLFRVILQ